MKLRRRKVVLALLAIAFSGTAIAASKAGQGALVDSGSFGIFVNGKRIGTEKFQVERQANASIATSEVTVADGQVQASQSSELKLSPTGDVQRYAWRELSPGKAESVVEPKNEFLVQHISAGPTEKAQDQPYILTPSTAILDDYFFSHRELLAWRYLAEACKTGEKECKLIPAQFPVLIPRQRLSITVRVEYAGREKVPVRGAERELDRFNLQSDDEDWALWFDDSHKLVRIVIAAQNIEIVRD